MHSLPEQKSSGQDKKMILRRTKRSSYRFFVSVRVENSDKTRGDAPKRPKDASTTSCHHPSYSFFALVPLEMVILERDAPKRPRGREHHLVPHPDAGQHTGEEHKVAP
jgi:hypothetical protein